MVIAMPTTQSPESVAANLHSKGLETDTKVEEATDSQQQDSSATSHHKHGVIKKKKGGLSLSALKSPFKFLGKTYCKGCKKKCSGEVLRVNDIYFHNQCFRCTGCDGNLSQGGFFTRGKDYYCAACYQANFGTKCANCNQFVEGEVVTALGKTYHQNCFRCGSCQKPFPTGERVTFTGKSCLCQSCSAVANGMIHLAKNSEENNLQVVSETRTNGTTDTTLTKDAAKTTTKKLPDAGKCAGCNSELKDGQALMALDKHYHIWCFKCKACDTLLHGEYMGKDGEPYCEKDYQALFGVKCSYCFRFISGKVLQAGDNNHFHPTCARCTKCGEPFGDGEEMFLQGTAIWHPRCGPSPDDSGLVVNGSGFGYDSGMGAASPYMSRSGVGPHDVDRTSTASEMVTGGMHSSYHAGAAYGSRASSPGAFLRRDRDTFHWRSTSQMAGGKTFSPSLYSSSSTYSLRRPLEPGDRTGSTCHLTQFHLPSHRRSGTSHAASGRFSRQSMDSIPVGGGCRPVSAPPKPGYTHASIRSSTLPIGAAAPSSNASFTPVHHTARAATLNGRGDYGCGYGASMLHSSDNRGDFSSDLIRSSNTYTHGNRGSMLSAGRGVTPQASTPVITEHKIYPLHILFTSNYKLPPDIDRCNLEKHLSDADFEMAFEMSRDDFYALPLWRRNNFKRRVRLF